MNGQTRALKTLRTWSSFAVQAEKIGIELRESGAVASVTGAVLCECQAEVFQRALELRREIKPERRRHGLDELDIVASLKLDVPHIKSQHDTHFYARQLG